MGNTVRVNAKKMTNTFDDLHGRRDSLTSRFLELVDKVEFVSKELSGVDKAHKIAVKRNRKMFESVNKKFVDMQKRFEVHEKKAPR